MEKQIRFGDLVRNSGRPGFITLWTAPEKDPKVRRATKENRVLTVIEQPGKRPYGKLGLQRGAHSVFLVFPRPLPREPEARVVGIHYQLAEEPEFAPPGSPRQRRPKLPPRKKSFTIHVRRTATLDEPLKVQAVDREEAEEKAMEQAKRNRFDLDRATVQEEIVKAE